MLSSLGLRFVLSKFNGKFAVVVLSLVAICANVSAQTVTSTQTVTETVRLDRVSYLYIYSYASSTYGTVAVIYHSGISYGYYTYQPMVTLDGSESKQAMYTMILTALSTQQPLEITYNEVCISYYGHINCFRQITKVGI